MPVAVQNVTKTIVILSNPDGESIEWDYSGAPGGGDIQEIPEEMWSSARMRRAANRGILSETTPEALDAAYAAQRNHIASASKGRMDKVAEALAIGTPNQQIVISADDMEAYTFNKERDGAVLEAAMADAEARGEAATNPLAAVLAAAE